MKLLLNIFLINLFLLVSPIRSQSYFKAWQSICSIYSCEAHLQQCISLGCFGKANCKSCVEDFSSTCSRCVDDIFDETAQITLPDSTKTIICNANNQLHSTVCNFYCRSLYKINYKCEIVSDFPVCNCNPIAPTTTTTPYKQSILTDIS